MLPMSPVPTLDDLVPATTSGSGTARRPAARSRNDAASSSRWRAANSPRTFSDRAINSSTDGTIDRAPSGRTASMASLDGATAKKLASTPPAWAPSDAAVARSASTSITSRSARSRSNPAASPAVSRRPSTSASSRSRSRLRASSRSRSCAAHRSVNASRRSARRRLIASSARLVDRLDAGRCGAHLEPSAARDRQQLRHHHHVLGDARHRLAIEGDARIGPARRGKHVGARHVHGSPHGLHARTLGREPRQGLGFGQR